MDPGSGSGMTNGTFYFVLYTSMSKWFNFLKLYLLVATIAWLFGTIIAYGIATYSGLEYVVLTDDEYVMTNNNRREIDNCSQPIYKPDTTVERTAEEKELCIAENTERLIKARKTDFKMTVLRWWVWGTIFLVLFLTHYPRFRKEQE